ncbi:MAG TPA: hypothetical protein VNQ79_00005 [Blastocatellia bacterium]|nr:hypothetical protein [Blastocatellia bacterium]
MKLQRIVFVAGLVICLAAILALGARSGAIRAGSKTHQDKSGRLPQLIADGAQQPDAIPDWVAYDFLLHSIAPPATATDRDKKIADALARETGLGNIKTYVLQRLADETNKQISVLDQQASALKDQYWPGPGPEVMQQLADLQKQKEAIIANFIAVLPTKIGEDGAQELSRHIRNHIKSKVRAFKEPPIEVYQKH